MQAEGATWAEAREKKIELLESIGGLLKLTLTVYHGDMGRIVLKIHER